MQQRLPPGQCWNHVVAEYAGLLNHGTPHAHLKHTPIACRELRAVNHGSITYTAKHGAGLQNRPFSLPHACFEGRTPAWYTDLTIECWPGGCKAPPGLLFLKGEHMAASPVALMVALGVGLLIGVHGNLVSLAGRVVGSTPTSFLINMVAGTISLVGMAVVLSNGGISLREIPRGTLVFAGIAGIISILMIVGGAYSLPKIGLAVGSAAFVAGQMVVAIVVDTAGLGGGEPIPLDGRRILGLVALAAAVYLLLPRSG